MTPFPSVSGSLRVAAAGIVFLLTTTFAASEPITYTGFLITDGQLGAWKFHNARVVLTFESNTKFIQTIPLVCVMNQDVVYDPTGEAWVTIADHQRVVTARFARNQIYASFDQDAGAIGIGSFSGPPFIPSSCGNPDSLSQPAYPLGLHHGTPDDAGPNSFPNNLEGNFGFSGKAYTCAGVPQHTECDPPNTPLKTDHGDLYLAQPYLEYDQDFPRTINGGFVIQEMGEYAGSAIPASVLAPSSGAATGHVTYHMFLVSDVSLNGQLFQGASIHLSFRSSTRNVMQGAGPNSAMSSRGTATVEIKKDGRTMVAHFAPGQIYVYFDPATGVGFGSLSGGPAYPAVLAPTYVHGDTELFAAVSDILINGSSSYGTYSQPTIDLAQTTDLKHETMLADFVSSCADFDFGSGYCKDLSTIPVLETDKGDFQLFEPYNTNGNNDPTTNLLRSSINFGAFWTTFDPED
jgi:hypothetical protein